MTTQVQIEKEQALAAATTWWQGRSFPLQPQDGPYPCSACGRPISRREGTSLIGATMRCPECTESYFAAVVAPEAVAPPVPTPRPPAAVPPEAAPAPVPPADGRSETLPLSEPVPAAGPPGPVPPPPPGAPPRRPGRRPRTWLVVTAVVAVVGLVTAGLLFWAPWKPKGPPPAPTAVHVVTTTDDSVTIGWSAPQDKERPDTYQVVTGENHRLLSSVPGSQTTYTWTGLQPATDYPLQVRATWKNQSSPYTATVVATTTLPPAPADVSVQGAGPDSVTIGWSPPPGKPTPDRYDIVTGDAHTVVGSVPGTGETVFTWTGLNPVTDYPVQVVAYWGNQPSDYSDAVVATTTPPIPDARLSGDLPVQLTVTSSNAGINVGEAWSDSWTFTPSCDTGPCPTTADGGVTPSGYSTHTFSVPLNRDGAAYAGSAPAHITHCGATGSEVDVNDTVTLSITVTSGTMSGGTWLVNGWNGTLTVDSPYTVAGQYFCRAQSFTMSLSSAG